MKSPFFNTLNHKLFQNIADTAVDAIFFLDNLGTIIYCNMAASKMLGYTQVVTQAGSQLKISLYWLELLPSQMLSSAVLNCLKQKNSNSPS